MPFRTALGRSSRLAARAASTPCPATRLASPRLLATSVLLRAVRIAGRPSPVAKSMLSAPASYESWATAAITTTIGRRGYASGSGMSEEEVFSRIALILEGFDKVKDPSKITNTAHFEKDLGLDSLDTVEVVMAVEEEFSLEIPDKEADKIRSVDQAVDYIMAQPDAN